MIMKRRKNQYLLKILLLTTACYEIPGGPPQYNSSENFVNVNKAFGETATFDIRYASINNFIGEQIDGYEKGLCILTTQATEALKEAQKEAEQQGYRLKFFDCYRPKEAVDHFIRWVNDYSNQTTKENYYPNVDKSKLIEEGYIAETSSHNRGSAVDLTLVHISDVTELDMGTRFDFFDPLSSHETTSITEEHKKNRLLLKKIMENNGFESYSKEWWHYKLKDEPFDKEQEFTFPVSKDSIS